LTQKRSKFNVSNRAFRALRRYYCTVAKKHDDNDKFRTRAIVTIEM